LILTDVEKVRLNHGKINKKALDSMSIAEAKRYLAEGHFSEGRMKSKVLACIRFLESGGGEGYNY
jgi:carbamate kinase